MAKLHALGALALISSAAGFGNHIFPTTPAEVVDSIAPLLTNANLPLVAQLSHMSNGKIPMAEMKYFKPVGSHTAHICEATDAAYSSTAVVVDGESGDTDYPFGKIKVLATVGEYDKESGFMLVGVPDGMGTHLKDDKTVRAEIVPLLPFCCTMRRTTRSVTFLSYLHITRSKRTCTPSFTTRQVLHNTGTPLHNTASAS